MPALKSFHPPDWLFYFFLVVVSLQDNEEERNKKNTNVNVMGLWWGSSRIPPQPRTH